MNSKFGFQVALFAQATCLTTVNLYENPIGYKEAFPSSHSLAYLVRVETSLISKAKNEEAQHVRSIHGHPTKGRGCPLWVLWGFWHLLSSIISLLLNLLLYSLSSEGQMYSPIKESLFPSSISARTFAPLLPDQRGV